jgi:hypothetical protein
MTRQTSVKPRVATLMSILLSAATAHAAGNDIQYGAISQSTFNSFLDELGAVVAYGAIAPAETLGVTGFDIGAAVTSYRINDAVWDRTVRDGSAPSRLQVGRVMARKGLPFGFDLGASYGKAQDSNMGTVGGELRKALIEGSSRSPAVSLLGHYATLLGVEAVDLSTYGIDLGISKGFAILTPYAGVGEVWYDGHDKSGLNLRNHSGALTRGYVGMRLGLAPFIGMTAQADFAEADSYSLRLDFDF